MRGPMSPSWLHALGSTPYRYKVNFRSLGSGCGLRWSTTLRFFLRSSLTTVVLRAPWLRPVAVIISRGVHRSGWLRRPSSVVSVIDFRRPWLLGLGLRLRDGLDLGDLGRLRLRRPAGRDLDRGCKLTDRGGRYLIGTVQPGCGGHLLDRGRQRFLEHLAGNGLRRHLGLRLIGEPARGLRQLGRLRPAGEPQDLGLRGGAHLHSPLCLRVNEHQTDTRG